MEAYLVTEANNIPDLVAQVNTLIKDGYEPMGGVSEVGTETETNSTYFCSQAMYKAPAKKKPKPRSSKKVVYWDFFEAVWGDYPKRSGSNPKQKAFAAFKARSHESEDKNINMTMALGANQYALFCDATGKTGTEYVMQAATFFGPDKHYENDWTVPTEGVPKNDSQLEAFAVKNGLHEIGRAPQNIQNIHQYRQWITERMK